MGKTRSQIASDAARVRWSNRAPKACVYVVGPADGPQKIGVAQDVRARVRSLQIGNHEELLISHSVAVSEDAFLVEACAHNLLADSALRGEWFNVSPADALDAVNRAVVSVSEGWKRPKGSSGAGNPVVTFRLSPIIHQRLHEVCAERETTVSAVMQRAVEAFIDRVDDGPRTQPITEGLYNRPMITAPHLTDGHGKPVGLSPPSVPYGSRLKGSKK